MSVGFSNSERRRGERGRVVLPDGPTPEKDGNHAS